MEQMISNIWQINALIGGILVFLLLMTMTIMMILVIAFAPFRSKYNDK